MPEPTEPDGPGEAIEINEGFIPRRKGGRITVCMSLSDRLFQLVEKAAELERCTPSEFARRVLDIHFVRNEYDEQIMLRLSMIEARLSAMESRFIDASIEESEETGR